MLLDYPNALPVIRLATAGEASAVLACVTAAFEVYIELESNIEGVLVQCETPDGFYIDTVASSPSPRRAASCSAN
jgi:hypothetical protein